jgi:hypothetical protein
MRTSRLDQSMPVPLSDLYQAFAFLRAPRDSFIDPEWLSIEAAIG